MMRSRTRGFTLIEMIAVIAIIVVLLAFLVPATTAMLHGNSVTGASQLIADRLSLARQTAVARNRTIEVRFYKYSDPRYPGSLNSLRAFQSFEMDKANSFVALESVQALPPGIIIDSGTTISSMAALMTSSSSSGTAILPRVNSVPYFTLHFLPNGSTDLSPLSDWFLTLHEEIRKDNLTTPPSNFITLDIDPIDGTLKSFRPGI